MCYESCYISANCNHTPTIADWGENNLICYGSCNAVYIYDPNVGAGGCVVKSLFSHTKRVNSVRWLKGCGPESELISGSTDSTAVVWSLQGSEYKPSVLKGHTSNINIVDGLYKDEDRKNAMVVTVSMDSTIKIWFRYLPTDEFSVIQTINLGYHIAIGIRLFNISKTNELLLATSVDNCQIEIYTYKVHGFEVVKVLKGHEGWVRGLDFTTDKNGDILFASSAQDSVIRVWRFVKHSQRLGEPKVYAESFNTNSTMYVIKLESILYGHDGWIYSVCWSCKDLKLLSASLDKSMIIWEYNNDSNLWMDSARVGEIGGNTLGFYGGVFAPDGQSILGHGYHGAFHVWNYNSVLDHWDPAITVGGHFKEVVDLSWEPKGEFLVSLSADQTTRIHAPWYDIKKEDATWHEIARPQVHGYDMSSLAVISRYKFVSSAEEKVIRVFEAPGNFVSNLRSICKISEKDDIDEIENYADYVPKGASVPSLGLSNKAIYEDNNDDQAIVKNKKDAFPEESHFTSIELDEPPTEETLLQNTLWPETQKLYGHGYEVYSLAASPDGKWLASACKATNAEHAAVLLWNIETWTLSQKLHSHTLTVAELAFSPDSSHLLSVSRDRRWSLFSKNSKGKFELEATVDKKTSIHTRIIWCCSWTHDNKYFATGSRDGKVVVWVKNPHDQKNPIGLYEAASDILNLNKESVTALAFAPTFIDKQYLLAVGLESGVISLYKWTKINGFVKPLLFHKESGHHLSVTRLAFRPVLGKTGIDKDENVVQLASSSADFSIKIHNVFLNAL